MTRFRKPVLALAIAIYLFMFSASPVIAGMIGSLASSPKMDAQIRGEEVNKIQRAMESRVVKEKMEAYGLRPEEVKDKLQGMSDDQIHMLSQASERLLAGADAGAGFVVVLLIILLVVLIIKLI